MSVSRPKGQKIISKPHGLVALAAAIPQRSKADSEKGGVKKKKEQNGGAASPIPVDLSISSDDEDDMELVPIPVAGPSSPRPGIRQTAVAPGSVDHNEGVTIGQDSDESEEEDDEDGVIHLEIGGETTGKKERKLALAMRKKPITARDRALRLEVHKVHVIALLASASIRNRWCNNSLLKARLLSLLPHPLQTAFNIPPSRFPDRAQRSRLFFDALQALVTWWSQTFFDISNFTLGLRTRPWDEVQETLDGLPGLSSLTNRHGNTGDAHDTRKGKKKAEAAEEGFMEKFAEEFGAERLRSVNSLMKKALQQEGSRDISAQLFVALARACGLGARLVTSLQAVSFRAEKVVQKKKPRGAGWGGKMLASRQGIGNEDEEEDEDDLEEVPIPGLDNSLGTKQNTGEVDERRLKDSADLYRLRKYKPQPQKLGTSSKPRKRVRKDLSDQPPVFWAEIFSRSDQRWIPVDPVRGIIRKKNHYEPTTDSGPVRLLYVVAFEEDGYARDVTLRYAKSFYAKTSKSRVPNKSGETDWWRDIVMGFLQRPYRLNRDELEDAELEMSQASERMPVHINGFKDHPIYVLERHLKYDQILHSAHPVGRFKGEGVYRRSSVVNCKTAENWMRSGRKVKEGQEPLKWVKQRAVTLQKRRAQELARQMGEEITQGLYAEHQTEIYRPPPIQDGVIPRNAFGNIDLYTSTMLPQGAVHLPYKGIAKVAKSLGISYSEACTGFEFKKQRAVPIINGIVIAQENEQVTREAYEESIAAAEEKELIKREEQALKRWVKLINGLRLHQRLQQDYGSSEAQGHAHNPLNDETSTHREGLQPTGKSVTEILAVSHKQNTITWEEKVGEPENFQDESDRDFEEIMEEANHGDGAHKIVSGTKTVPKIVLRFGGTTSSNIKEQDNLRKSTEARKRGITETVSLTAATVDKVQEHKKVSRARRKAAIVSPAQPEGMTRSLRSRASKTRAQQDQEQAKRERMKEAMESEVSE
ncbi:uncharacterized protein L203_105122 [Cryptococcus depauperatus CBS 7841]|uniref:Xeroderma pigmentosum group C-complementing protein n=1 Tax=Cryptococcus depauperatus CBS 7841 TaxID=1295531 RepID=A0AAJ8JWV4_9TREE